jgi:hypothetical protein
VFFLGDQSADFARLTLAPWVKQHAACAIGSEKQLVYREHQLA